MEKNNKKIDNFTLQLAEISDHVYSAEIGDFIGSYTVINVTNHEGKGGFTGYRSALYNKENSYVLAFAGSKDKGDWKTNYNAIVNGEAEQYRMAISEANKLLEKTQGRAFHFTGHSLGGGLASVAALETNGTATTFNAAGLTETLKKNLNIFNKTANIKAIVTKGEIIDYSQNKFLGIRAEGEIIELPAKYIEAVKNKISKSINLYRRAKNHLIGNLVKRLKEY